VPASLTGAEVKDIEDDHHGHLVQKSPLNSISYCKSTLVKVFTVGPTRVIVALNLRRRLSHSLPSCGLNSNKNEDESDLNLIANPKLDHDEKFNLQLFTECGKRCKHFSGCLLITDA
jgi:hypothetical protein